MELEKLIEQFNKDNSASLDKIEKIVETNIKAIQNASKLMLKVDINNIKRVDEFQKELTAHKAMLAGYYYQLAGLVKNKKAAYTVLLKNKAEQESVKFVSAAAESSANLAVAAERRLRDKIEGYLEAATELIRTCRNIKNNDESKYSTETETTGTSSNA